MYLRERQAVADPAGPGGGPGATMARPDDGKFEQGDVNE
jgi:hypothetical protein